MRLRTVVPALAGGLILGWVASAQAATGAPPPAAPIFYCPTPPAAPAPGKHTSARHVGGGCPMARVAVADHHHGHGRVHLEARRDVRGDQDVSASQAFIYRYERIHHGLDARAADAAWGPGPRPFGPHGMAMGPGGPLGHDGRDHDDGHAMGHPGPHGPAFADGGHDSHLMAHPGLDVHIFVAQTAIARGRRGRA